jgi:hypothetical protein
VLPAGDIGEGGQARKPLRDFIDCVSVFLKRSA